MTAAATMSSMSSPATARRLGPFRGLVDEPSLGDDSRRAGGRRRDQSVHRCDGHGVRFECRDGGSHQLEQEQHGCELPGWDRSVEPNIHVPDANRNLTADGSRPFESDVRNQLLAVNVGTRRTEIRLRRTPATGANTSKSTMSVTTKDSRFVWCQGTICERRTSDGSTLNSVW